MENIRKFEATLSAIGKIKSRKLRKTDPKRFTRHQRGQLAKEKIQYAEFLLTQCEDKVNLRRSSMWLNNIKASQEMCA